MKISARVRRLGAACVVAAGLAVAPATLASAHVSVSSTDASPGGFGKVVFRVPSESDTAQTVSISVALPIDTPFAFVSTQAVPGWDVETTTETLPAPVESNGFTITEAITSVTWTATSADTALQPHQFSEFAISAGPFPSDAASLVFPATQTYSDGEIVEWADPVVEGEEEPARPAPVLQLAATPTVAEVNDPVSSDDATAASAEASSEPAAIGVDTADGGSDTLARVLGGLGLALGLISIAWVGLGRRSKSPTT